MRPANIGALRRGSRPTVSGRGACVTRLAQLAVGPAAARGSALGRGRIGLGAALRAPRLASDGVRAASSSAPTRDDREAAEPGPDRGRQRGERPGVVEGVAAASRVVGVPMIATTIATPSAAPTWRATELRPVAVAKLSPGAEATAAPLRFGNVMPAPMPSRTMPGSHSPTKSGVGPTWMTNQSTAPPQTEAAGDEHGTVPEALGEPARRARDGGGDERAGRQREARLEHRVLPDPRQEEDVDERVAVEAGGGDDRHRVRDREGADPQQAEVDDRRAVPGCSAERQTRRGRTAAANAAERSRGLVQPHSGALDDAEHQSADREREERARRAGRACAGARARGSRPAAAARARRRRSRSGTLTRKTSRQSAAADQQAAERRADAGGERADRGRAARRRARGARRGKPRARGQARTGPAAPRRAPGGRGTRPAAWPRARPRTAPRRA